MTRSELDAILKNHVADVRFLRRLPRPGKPQTRRMLCTKSLELLGSPKGRAILNYRPPVGMPIYDPVEKNLIIVWDIFMQNYRQINCDQFSILNKLKDGDEFWAYFDKSLRAMSTSEKEMYMRS